MKNLLEVWDIAFPKKEKKEKKDIEKEHDISSILKGGEKKDKQKKKKYNKKHYEEKLGLWTRH